MWLTRSLLTALALALGGCAAEQADTESAAPAAPREEETPARPREPDAPAPKPAPSASGPTCSEAPLQATSYSVGTTCAPLGEGLAACNGKTIASGFVYACADEAGLPRRPLMAGCLDYTRTPDAQITSTLCPDSPCVRFAARDESFAGKRRLGWACPARETAVVGLPGGKNCLGMGSWGFAGSSGPLFLCDE